MNRDSVVRTGQSGCKEIPRIARNDGTMAGCGGQGNAREQERLEGAIALGREARDIGEVAGGRKTQGNVREREWNKGRKPCHSERGRKAERRICCVGSWPE